MLHFMGPQSVEYDLFTEQQQIKLYYGYEYRNLFKVFSSIILGAYLDMKLLANMVILALIFQGTTIIFFNWECSCFTIFF